jgi:two-component system chemotaxis response regulator CheB
MKQVTVLIVDDSALIRHLFTELLSSDPGIRVIGTAEDPFDARTKIKELNPDVITLDIEMPKMDGLSFLEKIMTLRPMPVLMVSTLTQKGSAETLRALELGAVDYIAKPTGGEIENQLGTLQQELCEKVHAAAASRVATRKVAASISAPPAPSTLSYTPHTAAPHLIAIGASTGGVETLRTIFGSLPGNLPPILITQHMPVQFTASFALRLDSLSPITTAEATHQQKLLPGHAYVAPGNQHLRVVRQGNDYYSLLDGEGEPISGHRPSVDALYESVAEQAGAHALGVLLTGMGKDGANGLLAMRQKGAHTIGQNEATCVVYGMPKAAQALGAVAEELALSAIPARIVAFCNSPAHP